MNPYYKDLAPKKRFSLPTWYIIYPLALGMILLICSPLIVWVVKSHFEADAYNRITHQKVTTWDAMWVELRVHGGNATAEEEK